MLRIRIPQEVAAPVGATPDTRNIRQCCLDVLRLLVWRGCRAMLCTPTGGWSISTGCHAVLDNFWSNMRVWYKSGLNFGTIKPTLIWVQF